MTPQEALRQLIESSDFSEERKQEMVKAIDTMSEEDMMALGKALAERKKAQVAAAQNAVEKIDEFLAAEPPEPES